MKPRTLKIWKEFFRRIEPFFTNKDNLEDLAKKMNKQGFVLEFIKPTEPDGQGDQDFFTEVIDHLNLKAGTAFRTRMPCANATLIIAQRKAGFTMEDFKRVIDKKSEAWVGTIYAEALSPETLFSKRHMDNYLGQNSRKHGHPPLSTKKGATERIDEAGAGAKRPV